MSTDVLEKAKQAFDEALEADFQVLLERWRKHVEGVTIEHKGGAGSGHHGHSGRLGKHGGSLPGTGSPAKPNFVTVYHGTRVEYIDRIKRDGIKRGPPASDDGRPPAVYFTTQKEEALHYIDVAHAWRGKAAVIQFEVDMSDAKFDEFDANALGSDASWYVERDILPEALIQIEFYKIKDPYNAGYPIGAQQIEDNGKLTTYGYLLTDEYKLKELSTGYIVVLLEEDAIEEKQLPIDQQSKSNLLKLRTGIFFDEIDELTEKMYTGQISLGEYQETFKRMVRELNTSTAAIGKGGWDNMTSRDWGRTGPAIREQYRYLQGFVEYIDDNRDTVSLKQLQARARLYGYGGERTAVMVGTPVSIADLLPWLPKDGSTECLNGCKCKWLLIVVNTFGGQKHVEATWVVDPAAESCDDCVGRDGHIEIFSVPEHVEVPSQIGGY